MKTNREEEKRGPVEPDHLPRRRTLLPSRKETAGSATEQVKLRCIRNQQTVNSLISSLVLRINLSLSRTYRGCLPLHRKHPVSIRSFVPSSPAPLNSIPYHPHPGFWAASRHLAMSPINENGGHFWELNHGQEQLEVSYERFRPFGFGARSASPLHLTTTTTTKQILSPPRSPPFLHRTG